VNKNNEKKASSLFLTNEKKIIHYSNIVDVNGQVKGENDDFDDVPAQK
jgi:hypothetical protein